MSTLKLPSGNDFSHDDFSGRDLSSSDFRNYKFIGTRLNGCNLSLARMNGSRLQDAYLCGAKLVEADLRGAQLSDSNLEGSDLRRADFSGADLRRADLRNANLSDTNLNGANVQGAKFRGCIGLNENVKRNLKRRGAIFEDSETGLAEEMNRWWMQYVIVPLIIASVGSSGIIGIITALNGSSSSLPTPAPAAKPAEQDTQRSNLVPIVKPTTQKNSSLKR